MNENTVPDYKHHIELCPPKVTNAMSNHLQHVSVKSDMSLLTEMCWCWFLTTAFVT